MIEGAIYGALGVNVIAGCLVARALYLTSDGNSPVRSCGKLKRVGILAMVALLWPVSVFALSEIALRTDRTMD